jgi:hypothetical protein
MAQHGAKISSVGIFMMMMAWRVFLFYGGSLLSGLTGGERG